MQQRVGNPLNVQHNSIAVHGPELRETFQDEEIQRPLEIIFRHQSPASSHTLDI
jgi:hypothetical protein